MINLLHIDDEKFNLWISMVFGIKGGGRLWLQKVY